MKTNTCKICGWEGSTHLHHIIPLSDYGEDLEKNIVEICPNHHSEAQDNEKEFAIKYKLIGERFTKEKLQDLSEGSILFGYFTNNNSNNNEKEKLITIINKYKFDKIDFIAFMMGVTRKSVERVVL